MCSVDGFRVRGGMEGWWGAAAAAGNNWWLNQGSSDSVSTTPLPSLLLSLSLISHIIGKRGSQTSHVKSLQNRSLSVAVGGGSVSRWRCNVE
ncbi:hypothetical protein CDAR_4641 [Caerostris darwini]|uniref:K Homology domain-containing protein n=1 Tax=Caerostris darwini TaxID=1538125 RepID=A0AAV4P4X1_9ARAC|nr:hypothetical protein CDAR_4641 [Caerostris darwini]